MNFLIALSENDKRIILALLLLLILVFVIVGYLGLLVEKVMKKQGNKISSMMHDVVAAKVVTNKRSFIKLAKKKSNRLFVKQSFIPILILIFGALIYILYGAITKHWNLNLFDHKKEGFSTILFLWDFPNAPKAKFFGMEIISGWPPILNKPHFELSAWASYIIVPCIFIGGIWLLIASQAHIARFFRLNKLSKTVFNPTLDNYNVSNLPNNNVNNNIQK